MICYLMNFISVRLACCSKTSTASRVWIYSKYTCFCKYFMCLGASFTQKFIQRDTIIQIFKTIHGIHKNSYKLKHFKFNEFGEFWWVLVSSMNSYECNCFDTFQSRCHYRWHLCMVGIYITGVSDCWCNFSFQSSHLVATIYSRLEKYNKNHRA